MNTFSEEYTAEDAHEDRAAEIRAEVIANLEEKSLLADLAEIPFARLTRAKVPDHLIGRIVREVRDAYVDYDVAIAMQQPDDEDCIEVVPPDVIVERVLREEGVRL